MASRRRQRAGRAGTRLAGGGVGRGGVSARRPGQRPVSYTHLDVYKRQPASPGRRPGGWRAGGAAAGGRSQPRPRTEAARPGLRDRPQGAGRERRRVSAPAPRCRPRGRGSAVPSVRPLPRPPSADTSASHSAASQPGSRPPCPLSSAACHVFAFAALLSSLAVSYPHLDVYKRQPASPGRRPGGWRAGGAAAGGRSQPRPRTEAARPGLRDRPQGAGRERRRVSAPAPRCRPRGRGSAVPSVRPLPRPPSADTSASHSAASQPGSRPPCPLSSAACHVFAFAALLSSLAVSYPHLDVYKRQPASPGRRPGGWRAGGAAAGGRSQPRPRTEAARPGLRDRPQGAGRERRRVSAPAPRCRPRGRGSAVPSVRPLPRPPSADTSASHSAASQPGSRPPCPLSSAACHVFAFAALLSSLAVSYPHLDVYKRQPASPGRRPGGWRAGGAAAGGRSQPRPRTEAARPGLRDRPQGAGRERRRVSAPAPRCRPRGRGSAVPSVRPLPRPPSADTSASHSAASQPGSRPPCPLSSAACHVFAFAALLSSLAVSYPHLDVYKRQPASPGRRPGGWRAGGAAAGGRSQPRPRTEAARPGLRDRPQGAGRERRRVSAPAPRCRPRGRGSAVPSVRPLPRPPSADTSASHSAASQPGSRPPCPLSSAACHVFAFAALLSSLAVSYPHLDVYKRQSLLSAAARARALRGGGGGGGLGSGGGGGASRTRTHVARKPRPQARAPPSRTRFPVSI
ncbi:hypothetical protein NN561_008896 [Cricetulus griseus]